MHATDPAVDTVESGCGRRFPRALQGRYRHFYFEHIELIVSERALDGSAKRSSGCGAAILFDRRTRTLSILAVTILTDIVLGIGRDLHLTGRFTRQTGGVHS